jgi:hypothetical protein
VDEVDVLLFKSNDEFYYRAIGTRPPEAGASKTFTAKLPLGTYRVVVLANARAAISASTYASALTPATEATGTPPSRAQVLGGIVMTATTGVPVTGNIPMWGDESSVSITDGTTTVGPIELTRAVTRVDVSLKSGITNFTLASVRLYNRQTAGSIAPVVTGSGYSPWTGASATLNIPAVSGREGTGVLYNSSTPGFTTTASRGAIYTFEAPKGTTVDPGWKNNPCLVIGGYYDDGVHAPALTYYRVDFATDPEDGDSYLALLRNHGYDVEIKEVKAHGYPEPEEAFEARPANIVVTITPWNSGNLDEITFNDQHYLAVNKSTVEFQAFSNTKSILVTTDYGGWTIEEISDDWFDVTPKSYTGGDAPRTLEITVEDVVDEGRQGHFYIVAGNLRKKIIVKQSTEMFALEVDPLNLTFYQGQTRAREVHLYPVYPATATPATDYPFTFSATGNIDWATGYDPNDPADISNFAPGASFIELLPEDNNTGVSLGSSVLVTLTDASGAMPPRVAVVNVTRLARGMEFHAYTLPEYPAAGGTCTFGVVSEGPWLLAESASDGPYGWFELASVALAPDAYGYYPPVPSTVPHAFTLADNSGSYAPRTAVVDVTSNDAGFPASLSFTVKQAAGKEPYIVVTSPDPAVIDFGEAAGDEEEDAGIETNAGEWWIEVDDNYAHVIGAAKVGGTSLFPGIANALPTGVISPHDKAVATVTFTPKSGVAPAAFGTLPTVVKFWTRSGESGAIEKHDELTLTRENPLYWLFTGYNLGEGTLVPPPFSSPAPLAPAGEDVHLHAATNSDWWVKVDVDNNGTIDAEDEVSVTGYEGDSEYTVAKSVLATSNWRTNAQAATVGQRTVKITAGYDGIPSGEIQAITFTQPSHTISGANGLLNQNLGTTGGGPKNIEVVIESTAEKFNLRIRTAAASAWVTDPFERSPGTNVSIPIPQGGTSDRVLYICHVETGQVLYYISQGRYEFKTVTGGTVSIVDGELALNNYNCGPGWKIYDSASATSILVASNYPWASGYSAPATTSVQMEQRVITTDAIYSALTGTFYIYFMAKDIWGTVKFARTFNSELRYTSTSIGWTYISQFNYYGNMPVLCVVD